MRDEEREEHEMNSLRAVPAHWLRHTSATFDAPLRSPKDLQMDLRHSSLSTDNDKLITVCSPSVQKREG